MKKFLNSKGKTSLFLGAVNCLHVHSVIRSPLNHLCSPR